MSNLTHNIGFPEDLSSSPENDDDDNGLDEVALVQDAAALNEEMDPDIGGCVDANAPSFAPATAITANAAKPPDDGFFSPVEYVGAMKDTTDTWASGPWVIWSDQ